MSRQRYPNPSLAVIAVTLSLLASPWLAELPAVRAGEAVGESTEGSTAAVQATHPVRWRIPFARHLTGGTGDMECATAVSVARTGSKEVTVEVEFFEITGASVGSTSFPLNSADEPDVHVTNRNVSLEPFDSATANTSAGTPQFEGYALVSADDPRIFVGAYLVCSENGASDFPRLVTNLSAYPVGTTASFFEAGRPGSPSVPGPAPLTDSGS